MYIYIHVCIYIYIYSHMYVYIFGTYLCMYIYIYVYIYICIYILTYMYIHIFTCVYMYIYTYIKYVYIYIYICVSKQTRLHNLSLKHTCKIARGCMPARERQSVCTCACHMSTSFRTLFFYIFFLDLPSAKPSRGPHDDTLCLTAHFQTPRDTRVHPKAH